MTGGFSIRGDLVTLSDIDCPILAVIGEVDDIGQPASVRGIKRAAPQADVYEFLIRAGHFGLVVGSKAATQTWPTVAQWVKWLDGDGDMPEHVTPMALAARRTPRTRRPAHLPRGPRGHRGDGNGVQRGPVRGRRRRRGQQVGPRAGRRDGAHAAPAGPARTDQRSHPHLARPDHVRAGPRRARRRMPAVRRPCPHLRGGGSSHQQCRPRPDRGRRAPGRPRRCADGDSAQRAGGDIRAVAAGRGGGVDAAGRRSGGRGAARCGVGDHRRSEQSRSRPKTVHAGAGARRRRGT